MVKLISALIILVCPVLLLAQTTRGKIEEGIGFYNEEKFDQALNKFQDALLSEPENDRIQYNVAGTLYKKKKYEEALKEYQKVIGTEDLALEQQAYYNIGNTLYQLDKLPESILAYQQALKLNPNDQQAKYNLEYVRRKLKDNKNDQQQQQQQQQQQDQQQQQQDQQQQQQQQQQGDEEQPEEQQEQQQQQPQDQSGEENQEENLGQGGQEPLPDQLSREDAERILDALKNDEKDIQKKKKVEAKGRLRVDKDW